jgi:hypothetical protein
MKLYEHINVWNSVLPNELNGGFEPKSGQSSVTLTVKFTPIVVFRAETKERVLINGMGRSVSLSAY